MTWLVRKSSDKLSDRLGLVSIQRSRLRSRLRWFGHVERIDKDSLVKRCRKIAVEGLGEEVDHQILRLKSYDAILNTAQDRIKWTFAIK